MKKTMSDVIESAQNILDGKAASKKRQVKTHGDAIIDYVESIEGADVEKFASVVITGRLATLTLALDNMPEISAALAFADGRWQTALANGGVTSEKIEWSVPTRFFPKRENGEIVLGVSDFVRVYALDEAIATAAKVKRDMIAIRRSIDGEEQPKTEVAIGDELTVNWGKAQNPVNAVVERIDSKGDVYAMRDGGARAYRIRQWSTGQWSTRKEPL